MTLKYINKNIESLKEDLACTNKTIESIKNHKGLLEFSDEKLNRAYRLREEIEHRIQDLETRKSILLLQAMKAISTSNSELLEVLEANGVNIICNAEMQMTISDEDAALIPAIIDELAPAAAYDYTIENL